MVDTSCTSIDHTTTSTCFPEPATSSGHLGLLQRVVHASNLHPERLRERPTGPLTCTHDTFVPTSHPSGHWHPEATDGSFMHPTCTQRAPDGPSHPLLKCILAAIIFPASKNVAPQRLPAPERATDGLFTHQTCFQRAADGPSRPFKMRPRDHFPCTQTLRPSDYLHPK